MEMVSTAQLIERLEFLEEPWEVPEAPICRRCRYPLEKKVIWEEGSVEIVRTCKKCRCSVYESDV